MSTLANPLLKPDTEENRRREERHTEIRLLFPVSMILKIDAQTIDVEVVNYHHNGACLRVSSAPPDFLQKITTGKASLDLHLGNRKVRNNLPFRLAWQSVAQDGTFGIEFLTPQAEFVERPPRFPVHPEFPPQVTAADPMDPNRVIFFKVQNVSENGMLLLCSLTNKHLLPGLLMKRCQLNIPGQKTIDISLFIANTRRSDIPGMFEVGASVEGEKAEYVALARRYVSLLSPAEDGDRKEHAEPRLFSKHLKQGISYRIVSTEADYEKVLKLRYAAYGHHGKLKRGTGWEQQGDGLQNEGTLLAGFIGSKMICSVELRFSDGPTPFRAAKHLAGIGTSERTVEINKLSVHPSAQGSDIFIGIFQKMHSILVSKGGYDVLITATEKLAPLYARLGFYSTGIELPHPHLAEQKLNILILPMRYYLQAKQINPIAWITVYESTQRFLESVGVAKPLEARWTYKLKKQTGKFLQVFFRRARKAKRTNLPNDPTSTGASRTFVDPRWTSQHIIAPIIKPYILESDAMIGVDRTDLILNRIGVPRAFFNRQANWISVPFLDEFLDQFSKFGDIAELSRRSGERSLQPDQIGVKYFLLKHFVTPQQTFQATEKILPKFNQTRSYRLLDLQRNSCRVAIGTVPGQPLPKHRESCHNWQANFEAYFKIMTGTVGQVKKLACCYDGAPACIYEMKWAQARRILPTVLFAIVSTGVLLGAARLLLPFLQTVSFTWVALPVLCLGALITAIREMILRRSDSKAFTRQFERLEQEGNEKYSELQTAKTILDERYREARLLEETAKAIQASDELSQTLKVSLDAICKNFEFDRAFVMLADETRATLRTAAVACIAEGVEDLWGFRVDISALRPNSIFVSSVYHTGNPVLIDDVEAHFFQFNEASQKLIRRLGTRAFIIVPIPSETGRWGTLIADKTAPTKELTRTDLTLLQRVAQHLGIALDKQAKLDHERKARLLFQKYVPHEIINQINMGESAALGGQTRDIACLFLDIRDFTRMSGQLPPQGTLSLLNRFFTLVQDVVAKNGGWIDKFLGDGAFITWGAVGEPIHDCSGALRTARQILEGLGQFNKTLADEGFAPIQIGMGIHCGQAIVGNVGAQSRMEFTSIGGTVNLASRLESLSKELKAVLVVSEAVLERLTDAERTEFKQVDNVEVRGVPEPIRVGIVERPGTGGRKRKS